MTTIKPSATITPKALTSALSSEARITSFVDLFCGIGGFHYAAHNLGLKCVLACDIDEPCRKQYEHCHQTQVLGDIAEIKNKDLPPFDMLFAGFPCQPYSIIGLREGMNDRRGKVFYEIIRILRSAKPSAFVLENVKQLATHDQGQTISQMLNDMKRIGYDVDYQVLNALDYGLAHKRERIFIVGLLSGLNHFRWPKKKKAYKPLSTILEKKVDTKYYVSERIKKSRHLKHKSKHQLAIWHENKGGHISSHPYSCALRAGASHNYLLINGKRRLTPREMLRLQGFPECFEVIGSDADIKRQTGNAVPVPMAQAVIREVLYAASKNQRQNTGNTHALSA